MSQSSIWVLIAGENEAAIWSSQGGTSRLQQLIRQEGSSAAGSGADFAWRLMGELSRGARNKSCDGIIIMSDDVMLRALREVTVPEVKRLLVAEIFATPATLAAIPKEKVSQTEWGVAA